MDQPGNSHYALHMNQQTLNGHGGYYGRGYEANGYNGNAYNGYAEGTTGDYHASVPEARTAADASIDTSAQSSTDGNVQEASVPDDDLPDASQPEGVMTADTMEPNDGGAAIGQAQGTRDAMGGVIPGVNGTSPADRMRVLLARSTADHAATERAMASTLDDIRQRLASLERAAAEIRERAGAERGVADQVAEQLAPQAQRLVGMSATLDGLTAGLSTFSAQMSAIDGRLANTDSRLASADVKLVSTEGRVAALDTRFERLDERLDDQYDRVASIDGRVASIDGRLAAADGRVIALAGQFTDAIAPLADELRARPNRAEIEEMVTKIVEAAHNDLSTRLTSLEDTVLTLAEALLRPAPGHAPS
jgi:predicted  nucleic acid-binding Zn-ribbon protein